MLDVTDKNRWIRRHLEGGRPLFPQRNNLWINILDIVDRMGRRVGILQQHQVNEREDE